MLDSARNTYSHVQLRSNYLARLTHLQTVIGIATVNGSARRTNGGTEGIGKRQHDLVKVLLGLETTTTRHNTRGSREIRPVRLG
jgi:hypothetical protein